MEGPLKWLREDMGVGSASASAALVMGLGFL